MTTQNHQPAGIPIGGQFAPTAHAEPAVSLTPVADPFAHLSGMDKARAQGDYARQLNNEAAGAYVQDLSEKLRAINPEATYLYVNRKTDVEYGLTFTLDRVEDIHRNTVDVDLALVEDEMFQDAYLDPYITCDEDDDLGQELYIYLNNGD